MEGFTGDLVNQRVFQSLRRKPHLLAHQQAKLAENLSLTDPVIQLAGAAIDLHSPATHIAKPGVLLTEPQDLGARLEIHHLNAAHNPVEQFLGHLVKRRVLRHVIADVDEFGLHKTPCFRGGNWLSDREYSSGNP